MTAYISNNFKQLIVYQRMLELVKLVYKLTKKLPRSERFSLTDQMQRAVISVISNFAEGYRKKSAKDKLRFLSMSETSLTELEAQSDVCVVLEYWTENDRDLFLNKKQEVGFLLHQYTRKIN